MAAFATRTTLTATLLGGLVVACYGCERPLTLESFSGATMGTSYSVRVETSGGTEDTVALGALIEGELARMTRVMSTYEAESDVSRFGRHAGTAPVAVDASLLDVLAAAIEVCRRSAGAFDPTVAPLVDAWGFGPEDVLPPDSARIAALRDLVGCDDLVIDREAGTLAKSRPGTRIDLSGVAKGYAADRIGRALRDRGYGSALVDVGGELTAVGAHVDGRPWRVALEGPGETEPGTLGTIDLVDEAVATSGDFRNYYEYEGVLYAHIIDPRTGFPIQYRGFSVSVVHEDGAIADAWATALTVLGPEEGYELAEREGLGAVFAWRSPGGVRSRVTSALAGRVIPVG